MSDLRLTDGVLNGILTACSQLEADDPEVIPAKNAKESLRLHGEVVDALAWVNAERERRENLAKMGAPKIGARFVSRRDAILKPTRPTIFHVQDVILYYENCYHVVLRHYSRKRGWEFKIEAMGAFDPAAALYVPLEGA